MKLFLQPEDVWLFRDGRPFTAGGDHRARSLFPPLPSTVQGMLRSHHLLAVCRNVALSDKQAVRDAVGDATHFPPGFRLRGPFLAREESEGGARRIWRYFPLPEDATGEDGTFQALAPGPREEVVCSSCPTPRLLQEKALAKREGEWWLREDEMLKYLRGEAVHAVRGDRLYLRESRFGIAQDAARRTVAEHMLFEVEYIRPCEGVGLYVEVEGLEGWPQQGTLAAGGEHRAARFRQVDVGPLPSQPLPQRFKLYLATPTFFDRGWQPGDWGRFFEGSTPALQAAAIGRYRSLGGFDLAADPKDARAHKASRRYVPAGSVYFFESEGPVRLKADTISDDPAPIGWGQVLVGTW